ncbi:MAG: extracellular solute-binding protein [Candidatus Latescibacteria bacterium]|nr:extracellular solute-binding protein [Candidatus Latescibacterota bacterium]
MKDMKPISAIVVAVCALTLGGCGGPEKTPMVEVDLETVDPQNQQVTFWYQHTRQREEALETLIAEYNQENTHGIQVVGEYAGAYSDIYNKMLVGLQGGSLPGLVVAYQNQAQAYYRDGGVVDLQAYMDSPKWGLSKEERADLFQAFLKQDNVGGVQMGFPPNRSMEILYYNMDWLQELGYDGPPSSWDQFAEMCRKARDQPFSKSANSKRSLGFLLEFDASRLASMVFSRGGAYMTADGSAYTLDTPQVREVMSLMHELEQDGAIEILTERYGDTSEFSVGQLLFALRSSSGLPFVKSGLESAGTVFNWGVAAPPYSGEEPVVNVYGASLSICRTTPEQQLAAWLFIKWFTQPEQQARWVRASNYFPVRRSTAQELGTYLAENPPYQTAYELLDYGRSEPSVIGYEPVRRMIESAMVDIMEGENVDKVLARLEQKANETLANP